MKKLIDYLKRNYIYFLAFIAGFIIISTIYILQRVAPFGKHSLLDIDFFHQFGPMLAEMYDRVQNGASLIYSFSMGIGLPFFRNFMSLLSSPFNSIMFLFERGNLLMSWSIIIGIKSILAGVTMCYFLSKKFNSKHLAYIGLALLYAFCAYFTAYYWNIMWLDALILLPLIVYGIEKIIDDHKPLIYIISLALMLLANFFIGYMICLFSVLYFIAYLILQTKKFDLKLLFKKCLIFGFSSLLAGGLLAILLIPLYFVYTSVSAAGADWPTSQYYAFTLWEYFANHFSGVGSTVFASGISNAPNISVGILGITLFVLFFINPKIKFKIKIVYLTLLFILVISFFWAPLDFIWHIFHVPNDIPYRYSFIYSFVLIIIGAYAIFNLKHLKFIYVLSTYIFILGCISLLFFFDYINISIEMIIFNILIITIYFIIYALYHYYPVTKRYIPYVFVLAVILECSIVINHNWNINQPIEDFYRDYDNTIKAIDFIKENDDDIFRIERNFILTHADPSWYGYFGSTTFSSMYYENVAVMKNYLGLPGNGINSHYYKQTTPLYDLMFNIRYMFGDSVDTLRYTLFYDGKEIVYKKNYHSGLMFAVNHNIKEWHYLNDNPFISQNDFGSRATGITSIFKHLEYEEKTTLLDDEYGRKIIQYRFLNPGDNMYFYPSNHDIDFFIIDGTLYYLNEEFNYFNDIDEAIFVNNYVDFNEKYIINAYSEEDIFDIYVGYFNYRFDALYSYTIDHEKYEQVALIFQQNKVHITEFKEHYIRGQITLDEAKVIYTSIPYDEGWTVKVNGEKIETYKIGNTLLAFDLEEGVHQITLEFSPKGIGLGSVISGVSLTTLIVYIIIRKRVHKIL